MKASFSVLILPTALGKLRPHVPLIVEAFLMLVGVLFAAGAILMREDENRKITDQFVTWWVAVDDTQKAVISKSTAFLRLVSKIVSHAFDRLLGERVFSGRSVIVSFGASLMFTCSSFFLFSFLVDLQRRAHATGTLSLVSDFAMSLAFAFVGIAPAFLRKTWQLFAWAVLLLLSCRTVFYVGYVLLRMRGPYSTLHFFEDIGMLVLFSYVCDLFYITFTRLMFRAVQRKQLFGIVSIIIGNVFLGILFIFGPVLAGAKLLTLSGHGSFVVFVLLVSSPLVNAIDIVACGLAFAVAAFIFCYLYVFWPVVNRLLYRTTSLSVAEMRRVMWAVAIFLLSNPLLLKWLGRVY